MVTMFFAMQLMEATPDFFSDTKISEPDDKAEFVNHDDLFRAIAVLKFHQLRQKHTKPEKERFPALSRSFIPNKATFQHQT